MLNRLLLMIACVVSLPCYAQEAAQKPNWLPKNGPDAVDLLGCVSIAKVSDDKKSIVFARPAYSKVMETRMVNKTTFVTEQRTRSVQSNGSTVEQTYAVQVPMSTTVDEPFEARVPQGVLRFSVALDKVNDWEKVQAWDITGKEIENSALITRLAKPIHVVALERRQRGFTPIDPFYASILRPDTLVIYVPMGTIPVAATTPDPLVAPAPTAPVLPTPIRDPGK